MAHRPNILVFLTDDHGQWASSCYGSEFIHSPTMQRLSDDGVRLTRAFTPTPVCSPARATFFTGLLPSQHGVHDYITNDILPDGHTGIQQFQNIGQLLQTEGFRTGLSGKWHCGNSDGSAQPGFDFWFGYAETQYPHRGPIPFMLQDQRVEYDGYQSEAITEQAVHFINDQDADTPFFLFVGYVDTHTPYENHPERHVSQYDGLSVDDMVNESFAECHGSPKLPWPQDPKIQREYLSQYFGAVSMIDEQMDIVLTALKDKGLSENTLVVYTGDHGHNNGHHGMHCKGNATTPQNFIDESILVPSLWYWPGQIEGGRVIDLPFDHCDLFCTLLDAAGATVPESIETPGQSMLPTLTGESQEWRDMQFCEYGNARCVRTEEHKLIRRYPGPNGQFNDEFYDLQVDPRETVNVINDSAYSDRISLLDDALSAYFGTYETDTFRGTHIGDLIKLNNDEPWRRGLSEV